MLLALDEALKQVRAFAERHPPSSCHVDIQINGDSDLIIQQMLGNYQVRSENLVPLHRQANTLVASIQQIMDTQVRYQHVYRDNNAVADGECVILVRTTPSRIPPWRGIHLWHWIFTHLTPSTIHISALANQAMDSRTSSNVIVSTRRGSKSAHEDAIIPGGVDVWRPTLLYQRWYQPQIKQVANSYSPGRSTLGTSFADASILARDTITHRSND